MSFLAVMHGVSGNNWRLAECTCLGQSKEERIIIIIHMNKHSTYEFQVSVKVKVNIPFWLQFTCFNLGVQAIVWIPFKWGAWLYLQNNCPWTYGLCPLRDLLGYTLVSTSPSLIGGSGSLDSMLLYLFLSSNSVSKLPHTFSSISPSALLQSTCSPSA